MKFDVWRRFVLAVLLAMSVVMLPIATTLEAQQPGTPRTDTPRVVDADDDDFPWGLLGLLGLIGLAGLRRRPVEHVATRTSAHNRP